MTSGFSRREWVLGGSALGLGGIPDISFALAPIVTPEQFGAVGDGTTNDTLAFAAMSRFVNNRGRARIALKPKTYLVGLQSRKARPGYAFSPSDIMSFVGCTGPLVIQGNGARLRCAPGLRYGTFDARSGRRTTNAMPYFGSRDPAAPDLATPYVAMINVERCSGPIEITSIELDGNLGAAVVGGQYGDTGWQIGCSGIVLRNNTSSEQLSEIHSHHHLQDGIIIDGSPTSSSGSALERIVSEHNGRQGCSLVGGRAYSFVDCRFSHTGTAGLVSAPGAGFDIEGENKTIRDLRFRDCEFSNNTGPGLIADSGDSRGALFERCRFVGSRSWAAWPHKPGFKFVNCEFVGAIVSAFGDRDASRAANFIQCSFRDDPSLTPTRQVYAPKPLLTIAELPYSRNALFDRCRFDLTHSAVLPWSQSDVIYANCIMRQRSAKQAYPRGTYIGRNRIDGNVDLYSSKIRGELVLNGRTIKRQVIA